MLGLHLRRPEFLTNPFYKRPSHRFFFTVFKSSFVLKLKDTYISVEVSFFDASFSSLFLFCSSLFRNAIVCVILSNCLLLPAIKRLAIKLAIKVR